MFLTTKRLIISLFTGVRINILLAFFCLLSMVGAPVGNNELWRHTYNQDQCILGPGISASCVGS